MRRADPPSPSADEGRWVTSRLVPLAIIAIAVGIIIAIIVLARQEQDDGRAVLAGASVDAATLPVVVPYREVAGAIVIVVSLGPYRFTSATRSPGVSEKAISPSTSAPGKALRRIETESPLIASTGRPAAPTAPEETTRSPVRRR